MAALANKLSRAMVSKPLLISQRPSLPLAFGARHDANGAHYDRAWSRLGNNKPLSTWLANAHCQQQVGVGSNQFYCCPKPAPIKSGSKRPAGSALVGFV